MRDYAFDRSCSLCPNLSLLPDAKSRLAAVFSALGISDDTALADKLIAHFGSVSETVWASQNTLQMLGVPHHVMGALLMLKEVSVWLDEEQLPKRLDLSKPKALGAYLRKALAGQQQRQTWALYLDTRCQLLGRELMSLGTTNQIKVYHREIVKTALLKYNASKVILVQNHPEGDLTLADSAMLMYVRVAKALETVDIDLADIVVVARDGWRSLANEEAWPTYHYDY